MLEGKSKQVYFFPDSSIFEDTLYPRQTVLYMDVLNLRGNFLNEVELKKGETGTGVIFGPTFFYSHTTENEALVYPKERLNVKGLYSDYTFSTVNGSEKRDRELIFFKIFHELEKHPKVQYVLNASLSTILELEKQRKSEIILAKTASQLLFDSLIKVYNVSKKFKKLTKNYPEKRFDFDLFYSVYRKYKDTLMAHHLYIEKCRQFIPEFNTITKRSDLYNTSFALNDIAQELFPHKSRITSEAQLWTFFDSVQNNFTGLARDYLLSQLMYRAYTYGIEVSPTYLKKYKAFSIDKTYRRIIRKVMDERTQLDRMKVDSSLNYLLKIDGKKTCSLEEVLRENRGRYILVDFWASWCLPCKEEMPFWQKLVQQYPKEKIVFLNLSIDREIQSWRKAVIALNEEENNHYLLINVDNSPLIRQFNIMTIPRFMLFDREGKVVSSDAPPPSNPALCELLDGFIK